jgi:hypothetical protein
LAAASFSFLVRDDVFALLDARLGRLAGLFAFVFVFVFVLAFLLCFRIAMTAAY